MNIKKVTIIFTTLLQIATIIIIDLACTPMPDYFYDHWWVFRDYRVGISFRMPDSPAMCASLTSEEHHFQLYVYADGYRIATDTNRYILRLYLEININNSKRLLQIHPENAQITLANKLLDYKKVIYYDKKGKIRNYDIKYSLSSINDIETVFNETNNKDEYPIIIDLSKVIQLDSLFVDFDTIYAVQKYPIQICENDDYSPFD